MQGFSILIIFGGFFGVSIADVPEIDYQLNRCLGKHGVFLPITGSCNQYLTCVQGEAIISSCGDYHFNARLAICDIPGNAGCISFGPLPTELVKQPSPQPVDSICVSKANGVILPVAGNSRQYYLCINNKAFLKDCGKLFFNTKHSACAPFPDDGTPIKEKIRPPQKTEIVVVQPLPGQDGPLDEGIATKQEVKPPQKFENSVVLPPQELTGQHDTLSQELCQNQQFGARVAVRDSCNQYFICMGKTAIPKSCGQMQFNPLTKICDLPINVHCRVENFKVIYHQTEQLMPPSSHNSTSIHTSVCHGQRDGIFLAVPSKCSEFYFCFKNKSFLKTCGHRHFSPITMSCVELEESNCVEFKQPLQTEEQSKFKSATEALEVSCLNRDNGILLRHPLDCGKFIMCDNHVAVEMNCPAGLHFNTEKDYCDWPEMAKCFLNK